MVVGVMWKAAMEQESGEDERRVGEEAGGVAGEVWEDEGEGEESYSRDWTNFDL